MQKLKNYLNKKGQTLQLTSSTVISLLVLIFIVFAVLFGVATLNPGSFFTENSTEQIAVNALQANTATGISSFSQRIPTVFTVLGVVLALAAILILIVFVRRMQQTGGSGGGGGGL